MVSEEAMWGAFREGTDMPLYEYRCHHCKKVFEVLQKVGEDGAACPRCASADTERVMSAFSSGASEKGSCTIGAGRT